MNRRCAAGLALLPALAAAQVDDGSAWQLRLRTVHLDPGIRDTIGLFVDVNPRSFTEVDLSWFARPALAVELALTLPRRHVVTSAGFEVGQLRQLPPTLTLQAHHTVRGLRAYVGLGVSYTMVSNLRFAPQYSDSLQPSVRNHSIGPVVQAGLDLPLSAGWGLNIDLKHMRLATDLSRFGPQPGAFKVRPTLTSIGVSRRF